MKFSVALHNQDKQRIQLTMTAPHDLKFEIIPAHQLSSPQKQEILEICLDAYGEDLEEYLRLLPDPVHILARLSGVTVSHAAWVTRWLQVGGDRMLRTAYIELVATPSQYQKRGFGSALMRELVRHLDDHDLAALSPSNSAFYQALGWELWRGPLAIRTSEGTLPTPEEEVMIYRLPLTPVLDLNQGLTAEWRPAEVW